MTTQQIHINSYHNTVICISYLRTTFHMILIWCYMIVIWRSYDSQKSAVCGPYMHDRKSTSYTQRTVYCGNMNAKTYNVYDNKYFYKIYDMIWMLYVIHMIFFYMSVMISFDKKHHIQWAHMISYDIVMIFIWRLYDCNMMAPSKMGSTGVISALYKCHMYIIWLSYRFIFLVARKKHFGSKKGAGPYLPSLPLLTPPTPSLQTSKPA